MKLTGHMRIVCLVIVIGLTASLRADAPTAESLAVLLKELRELRQSKYALENQWEDERQGLQQLIRLEEARLKSLQQATADQKTVQDELNADLAARSLAQKERAQRLAQFEAGIKAAVTTLQVGAQQVQLVLDEAVCQEVKGLDATEKPLSDKINELLNLLLSTATDAAKVSCKDAQIVFGGDKYRGDKLAVGGVLEFFILPDDSLSLYRTRSSHEGEWARLDATQVQHIREAVQVLRNEIPARIITIPVPARLLERGN